MEEIEAAEARTNRAKDAIISYIEEVEMLLTVTAISGSMLN
jgi:hypothetical protein